MITISGEKIKTNLINGENIYVMSALGDSKGFEKTINKTNFGLSVIKLENIIIADFCIVYVSLCI